MESFLLFIMNLVLFVHVSVDAQNLFEPFLLYFNRNISSPWQVPKETIPSISDENVITLCPTETEEDKRNLDIISETYLFAKYCLYRKSFDQDQPKLCMEQPKPWLKLQYVYERYGKLCGTTPHHKKYEFGFYLCGSNIVHLRSFRRMGKGQRLLEIFQDYLEMKKTGRSSLPLFFPVYELCIDTLRGETIWTKHSIMTPAMFEDSEEKLQRETGEDIEISTDPYEFQASTFTDLKQKYDAQDEESNKMTMNLLVPKEHVAIRVWRNALNHLINVAPLWHKLEKLMTAVDQGIRKIALKLHSNDNRLNIHTKVVNFTDDGKLIQVNTQFANTIWYKLLHTRSLTAALVVIHNTPNSPPEKKICETEMPCNLEKWYEKKDDDDEEISDEALKYGYCCVPSTSEVQNLFEDKFSIRGPLNLDDYF